MNTQGKSLEDDLISAATEAEKKDLSEAPAQENDDVDCINLSDPADSDEEESHASASSNDTAKRNMKKFFSDPKNRAFVHFMVDMNNGTAYGTKGALTTKKDAKELVKLIEGFMGDFMGE